MSPRQEIDRWAYVGFFLFGLMCFVLALSRCASITGSSALQKTMADAEAEIASTNCRMLYACLGYRADIPAGQTCGDVLPTVVPPVGLVVPEPCRLLYTSRRDAKGHLGEAAAIVSNGSDAPELRRKLKRDIDGMKKADGELR